MVGLSSAVVTKVTRRSRTRSVDVSPGALTPSTEGTKTRVPLIVVLFLSFFTTTTPTLTRTDQEDVLYRYNSLVDPNYGKGKRRVFENHWGSRFKSPPPFSLSEWVLERTNPLFNETLPVQKVPRSLHHTTPTRFEVRHPMVDVTMSSLP